MYLLPRLPATLARRFGRAPKSSRTSRPAAKLWRSDLERLEERSVPAIISSQLPTGGVSGGSTSGTGPRGTIGGFVFCDENQNGVFDADLGEHGIAGVTIRLVRPGVGTVRVTQTDSSGLYFFGNLGRGPFRIVEVQPADVQQGQAILGTINGTITGRVITADRIALSLPAGANAVDYNFSEICTTQPPGGGTSGEENPPPVANQDTSCPIPDGGPAGFTVDGSTVTVNGTSQGDVFLVSQTGTQLTITFNFLDANGQVATETRTFNAADVSEINVNGQYGDDRLIVDNGGGLIGATINFDGGLGTDTLRLRNGVADSETLTAGQAEDTGSVAFTGSGGVTQTINYNDIGLIADTVAAASMTIVANNFQQPIEVLNGQTWGTATTTRVTGITRDHKVEICHHTHSATNPGVIIDIDRHALPAHLKGHGDEILSDEPPTTPIEFANKANVTVFGGNGNDFFLVNNPVGATGLQSLTLNGQNGPDVVNVQAAPPGVAMSYPDIEEQSGSP
jgi:SdrD B-like domain